VDDPQAALIAFQKHFRQRDCMGIADSETRSLLQWLLNKTGR
jgi:N-acetyl-anhydromuramyl-L-alanine amidase AmpD